ncbi:hypothetical protein C8A03DRAFT_32514 [Achaetomium macrosporum]|uniref:Uncharacterized protein n=1 Tax=Achaetomium macrosporum TaxID=79813 RepID=A0AAN7CCB9_9PEZI|nr:hypothetical protein C8A03DRAFT_32514 [Achaetomium macrosporum]
MPYDKSNKAGEAAVATDTSAGGTVSNGHAASGRKNASYMCGCRLCICGAAVDYPGDVCSTCSKYH